MAGLNAKQRLLIEAMSQGQALAAACRSLSIPESTARKWAATQAFKAELEQAQQAVFQDKLKLFRTGIGAAQNVVVRAMNEKAPLIVQLRAAQYWIDKAVDLHHDEAIEQRIRQLEELIHDRLG